MTDIFLKMITAPKFVDVWGDRNFKVGDIIVRRGSLFVITKKDSLRIGEAAYHIYDKMTGGYFHGYGDNWENPLIRSEWFFHFVPSQADLWERLTPGKWSLWKTENDVGKVLWILSYWGAGIDKPVFREFSAEECLAQALMYENNYIWRDGKWEKR